jgi:hypothetical protein
VIESVCGHSSRSTCPIGRKFLSEPLTGQPGEVVQSLRITYADCLLGLWSHDYELILKILLARLHFFTDPKGYTAIPRQNTTMTVFEVGYINLFAE